MTIVAIGLRRWRLSIDFLLILISFLLCQYILQWSDSYGGKEQLVSLYLRGSGTRKSKTGQVQRDVSPNHWLLILAILIVIIEQ